MKRTVTLALLLTAAICWAQVAVNYMPDENVVRTFGGEPGPWNGHDFVMNIMLDNGDSSNINYMIEKIAPYGGTLDIDISYNYADSTNNGGSGFVTPEDLLAFHLDGHGIHPQGMFKPWRSQVEDEENEITYGSQWDHGYASFTDIDSMALDMNRDSLAVLIGLDASHLKSISYPYAYSVGYNYSAAKSLGYEWGRTGRVYWDGEPWGFIEQGWYSGYPDPPVIIPPSLADGQRVNRYFIGGRADAKYVFGYGESLTKEQVEARVEERLIQPAIADGTFNLTMTIHQEPNQTELGWIIDYLAANYDVWFTDFDTMMEWWAPQNLLYPVDPPAGISAQGSQLAGIASDDSIWWQKSEPPAPNNCYVFSDGSTRELTIDGGLTPSTPTTGCETLEVRAGNPTTTYSGTEPIWAHYPLPIDTVSSANEALTALYFDCAATLSGKTISKAELVYHTGWAPTSPKRIHPDAQTGRKYVIIVGITDEDISGWTAYGTGAASYTNIDQATATAWPTALSEYATYEDFGISVRLPYATYDTETDYTQDVTDIVQAWADGSPEGGFMFAGTRLGYWVVSSHTNGTTTERPQLVVYTED